jgi:hypothetical protein
MTRSALRQTSGQQDFLSSIESDRTPAPMAPQSAHEHPRSKSQKKQELKANPVEVPELKNSGSATPG